MIINREVFSLPPYISTSWGHVAALYMKDDVLVVALDEGIVISIPSLVPNIVQQIFDAHAAYLTEEAKRGQTKQKLREMEGTVVEFPFKTSMGLDGMMSSSMQHNPEQAHAPDIPKDILNKIVGITKLLGPEDANQFPKAEPHCNCMYCQIARAVHSALDDDDAIEIVAENKREPIAPPTPHESSWIVAKEDEHIYNVHHKDSPEETFKVFLGDQVGCTCGQSGCAHMLAVLRS